MLAAFPLTLRGLLSADTLSAFPLPLRRVLSGDAQSAYPLPLRRVLSADALSAYPLPSRRVLSTEDCFGCFPPTFETSVVSTPDPMSAFSMFKTAFAAFLLPLRRVLSAGPMPASIVECCLLSPTFETSIVCSRPVRLHDVALLVLLLHTFHHKVGEDLEPCVVRHPRCRPRKDIFSKNFLQINFFTGVSNVMDRLSRESTAY